MCACLKKWECVNQQYFMIPWFMPIWCHKALKYHKALKNVENHKLPLTFPASTGKIPLKNTLPNEYKAGVILIRFYQVLLLIVRYFDYRIFLQSIALCSYLFSLVEPFPEPWNSKSIFLILKISQYSRLRQFFWGIQVRINIGVDISISQELWSPNWQAGISRGVASNEANLAGVGDANPLRSRDFEKI